MRDGAALDGIGHSQSGVTVGIVRAGLAEPVTEGMARAG